ncbi:hypothetical protein AUJ77_00245 [Candidatus Nomurabacteria bacterium CG1_02_43_90]|uniref:Type IV secretion system coupling protein TraD DNA-binding domain-containing protein n=1 Tax=Candidatus Nomurabacteria bacterium CG1_02_43_90 TaxID=1805281 RepID=A0A1J4V231_9BACT|nr:MAG: hypothetical protein AUJ77_00245 [Candidatus Nomurabacteria bacterium CG1_02_43_90]
MYLYDKNRITYFAETDRRNKRIPFGIKAEDRTRHMYIIGKTGMGKSTCIENMVVQDIRNGEGFAFIDPHGKSAALLLDYIPEDRLKDVVYFAPFDVDNPISFNVMEDVGPDKRHLVANGLMSAFKKIWGPETFSARMEYILMNALLALLEYPESTLLGVSRMLTDKVYRKKIVDNVKDPSVRAYWVDEFAKYSENYAKEAVPGIQNKLGQFTSNPLIRNIIGQPKSSFDLRKMMDERKILIVNLSKGQLGEGNAALLGGMIITKIYLAAMSRADLTEGELKKLPNFYMYVDEFQSFANESFADILSEARKYKLALTVAHQYIKQMDEKVADAVFGNVGTQIMFRVGAPDAEVLEKEYAPVFTAEDMVSLGFTQIYLKLMIDGVASHPFSAVTLGPIAPPKKSLREEALALSRSSYGRHREEVEKAIADWYMSGGSEGSSEPTRERPDSRGEHAPRPSTQPSRAPISPVDAEAIRERYSAQPRQNVAVTEKQHQSPQSPAKHQASSTKPGEKTSKGLPDSISALQKQGIPVSKNIETSGPSSAKMSFQNDKLEKPFAQAFKDLPKIDELEGQIRENEEPQSVSLSALAQPASGNKNGVIDFTKNKNPRPESLGSLKAALADVLVKEKKSTIPPLPSTPNKTFVNDEAKHDLPEKNKEEDVSSEKKQDIFREPVPPEKKEESKVKEVPEDVLMALLRGDN